MSSPLSLSPLYSSRSGTKTLIVETVSIQNVIPTMIISKVNIGNDLENKIDRS